MGPDFRNALNRLGEKAAIIARRHENMTKELEEARKTIDSLSKELTRKDEEIKRLEIELENLVIVKTAFPSKQAIAESREHLSELVREIDRCITDLTS